MKLLSINGSPRGEKGSTQLILDAFEKGFLSVQGAKMEKLTLQKKSDFSRAADAFKAADAVLLAYPLYTDIMPGLTMAFIESLAPLVGKCNDKPLGFIVQSGFPEACQSRPAKRYNEKLAKRLGCAYAGTAIRGNCNRLEVQPSFVVNGMLKLFEAIGASMAKSRVMSPALLKQCAVPERLGGFSRFMMRLLKNSRLVNIYWNRELKRNNAWNDRNATPYANGG